MVSITVDENGEFTRVLKKAIKELDDLRVPLSLISKQWFKSNRAIFDLKSEGKYAPYKNKSYENNKIKRYGRVSMLKASGALEKSITDPSNRYAVNLIVNKKHMFLGSKVLSKRGAPYAIYLQNGTKFMKARPPILFGTEQTAPTSLNKRVDLWRIMLMEYSLQKSKTFGTIK